MFRRMARSLLAFVMITSGVVVGVSALIVVMGVMNGLQRDLREKILIGSPDIRVLNFGADPARLRGMREILLN